MNDEVGQPIASELTHSRLQQWLQATRNYLNECMRVLRVTKKPTLFEFKTVVKVSALGLLVIGFIGFLIFIIGKVLV